MLPSPLESVRPSARLQLLVVESELSFQRTLVHDFMGEEVGGEVARNLREALHQLSTRSFDAIVVDLRLKRFSGLRLLENLRRLQPDLPLVATGWAAEPLELRSLSKAQVLFLKKPYDASMLARMLAHAIPEQTSNARPSVPVRPQLQQVARRAVAEGSFPVLDARALDLQRLRANDDCSIEAIVELLESDVRVTASILSRANAVLNRGSATLTTLREACVRLGTRDTFAVALRTLMESAFETKGEIFKRVLDERWQLSRASALVARALARRVELEMPDEIYVAALMSHVGELFAVWVLSKKDDAMLIVEEGYLRSEVMEIEEKLGVSLRQRWMLPQRLCDLCERTDRTDSLERNRRIMNVARTVATFALNPPRDDEEQMHAARDQCFDALESIGAAEDGLDELLVLATTAREN